LIIQYSYYHQAIFGDNANAITGKVNEQFDKIDYYFQLKKTNDSLLKANEVLYNKLASNFNVPDSGSKQIIDSIKIDSILKYRKFNYLTAKVVANSVASQGNFIVLQSSKSAQIKIGTGIVDINNAVVGAVTDVDGEFVVVMSLLHKDSHISGKLLKTGETGTVSWDGKYPNLVTLSGIPKSAKMAKGDTVITSGYSTIFPKGLMLGRVDEVFLDKSTNNYKITLRTATNFYNLEYAYVINNAQQEEIDKLLEKAKNMSK
jgi:rod shape-determining protein MreC